MDTLTPDLTDIQIDPARLRTARGSRRAAAVARMIGTTRSCICNWEHGTNQPPSYLLARLCILYGVTVQDLIVKKTSQNI